MKKKPWNKNSYFLKRRVNFRELREKILIVCEGERTEPNYFEGFKVNKQIVKVDISGTGYNTVSLVDEAIRLKTESESKREPYNQTWCVFDKDSFSDNDFNCAIKKALDNKIKTAYSNEAFELWYLLHFHYYNTAITREQYMEKLSGQLNRKYKKNDPRMYNELLDKQSIAIRNAKNLLNAFTNNMTYSRRNPSTEVYLLVEELNKFIEEIQS
jgi:hypothetical protein